MKNSYYLLTIFLSTSFCSIYAQDNGVTQTINSTGYTVPVGKTLYIHTAAKSNYTGPIALIINGNSYFKLPDNEGHSFNSPLVVKSGETVTTISNVQISGVLSNDDNGVTQTVNSTGYTVPVGKTLYIHTAAKSNYTGPIALIINGNSYFKLPDNEGHSFNSPLVVKSGETVSTITNVEISGVLSNNYVGVDNLSNEFDKTFIYPNPCNNRLNILSNLKINKVEVLDVLGRKIDFIKQYSNNLDITSLNNGIYFLKLIYKNKTHLIKFIKQ